MIGIILVVFMVTMTLAFAPDAITTVWIIAPWATGAVGMAVVLYLLALIVRKTISLAREYPNETVFFGFLYGGYGIAHFYLHLL